MEDQELIRRLLNGDATVFTLLVKHTEGLVAQIVFKMVANVEDRKDLIQDIYLNAYRNIKGFKFQSKLSTWVGSIAYNACCNYLQKKRCLLIEKTLEDGTDDQVLETLANHFVDHSSNETLNHIFRSELQTIFKIAIDHLPPLYSTLITLYHYEEMSYQEISQITSLPEGTLKNYLFRARKKLKDYVLLNHKKEDL